MATDLSAETRARILETAWGRVRDQGAEAVSVKAIATEAGVSRQLVYFHFGNRAGLLRAMARHGDRASGFTRRVVAARELPPAEALEALLREWCAYLPELLPVARALEAALITGDEGGDAWTDRMEDLREAFRLALERVALKPGWTVDDAADWVFARVHPAVYEHLVGRRGWIPARYTDLTVRSLLDELLA
jgi:AcrR family transcriptional regulator